MPTPTVAVTVQLNEQDGAPIVGVTVHAKLDKNDIYNGFVVSDLSEAVTDSNGTAVLQCFPNALAPAGLGTLGTVYRFTANNPGGKSLRVLAQVPNSPCNLHSIAIIEPQGSLSDAQLVLSQAQAAVALSQGSAVVATASADEAALEAAAAQASATATAALINSVALSNRGVWATATSYLVRDFFSYGGLYYSVGVAHISGVFATDLAAGKFIPSDFLSFTNALAGATGSDSVGHMPAGTGAVATSLRKKMRTLEVTPFDFLTTAERDDIESGTYAMDNTAALQLALNHCASASRGRGRPLRLNASYRASGSLNIPAEYISIVGDGQWLTGIDFTGSGSCLRSVSMTYMRPHFEDFYICGGAGTGKAMDLSTVTGQVYLGAIRNLYLQSGDDAFYAPRFFSIAVNNVAAYSYAGHSFRAQCGPGVSLISLYALTCGAGKAGYRLGGNINMHSCNGVNSGERWAIFGNDLSSADGWQTDFASNDLPSILMTECNIEEFGVEGLRVQSGFDRFEVQGGKIDRNNLSSAYQSLVHCRSSPNQGTQAVRLGFGKVFLGGGTPALGHLYSGGAARFFDTSDKLFNAGVTSFKNTSTTYPLLRHWVAPDVYGSNAHSFSSLTARQMSMQTVRYMQPASLNPVGTNQAIVVTGYTKVTVTPAATASISTATFDATPNVVSDYGRNGELIIEAGNANLTINHAALGAGGNTYVLKAGANLPMATGQIAYFCRSLITNQWIQI